MAWTLSFNGEEKSFEEWGFSQLRRRTQNFSHEIVTFVKESASIDEDSDFSYDDEITIKQDGEVWFIGRVMDPQRMGSGGESESILYEVWGLFSWLNRLVYRQLWRYLIDPEDPASNKFSLLLSDLVMFQKIDDGISSIATIKEQVESIFQYRVDYWTNRSATPKFQLDSTRIPTHQAPFIEVSNITCQMALEYALKTVPDVAVWVDYATTPPTIRIARRGTAEAVAAAPDDYLEAVTLTLAQPGDGDGNPLVKAELQPRSDLQTPAVVIQYRQSNNINGVNIPFAVDDIWPIGADTTAEDVVPQTVNLEGSNLTYPEAVLSVRAIDKDSADWWRLHELSLSKPNITNLKIREATRSGNLPYEILPGSDAWAPWMTNSSAQEDSIECYADWDRTETKNGTTEVVERVRGQLLSVRVMTTDLPSGVYRGNAQGTIGEPMPSGLSRALYEAASEQHWEGIVTLQESECSGLVRVGNVLNIKNEKRPEWATMRAFVQSVEEDIDTGTTTVKVGPHKFLGVNELMEWMRGLRRSNQGQWAARINGINAGSGALRVAARPHKETILASKESKERLVLMRPANGSPSTGETTAQTQLVEQVKIIIDVLDAMGLEIKLREYAICIDNVKWYFTALGSDKYQTKKTPNPIGD